MASATLLTGGSVPKGLENPMKERKVIRITDIARKENSMTDKENFRAEIEKAYNEAQNRVKLVKDEYWEGKVDAYRNVLCIFDSIQEECNITGIKSRHATGKLKECIDNQTEEGLEQARKQLEENPKKCMYARDNYTDDRKVLCEGCEEKCEYAQKEADWLQELHCKLDSLSKEDFEKVWAKYHQKEEPISEDLEKAINFYIENNFFGSETLGFFSNRTKEEPNDQDIALAIEYGMRLQKEQMMTKAIRGRVSVESNYHNLIYGCWDMDNALKNCNDGDKVKVIIIREDLL